MSESLAELVAALIPSLRHRDMVSIAPTTRPPALGAWAPNQLSVQLVLSGRIRLGIPNESDIHWKTLTDKHILLVQPHAWSPRTQETTRRHLAFSFDQHISVSEFHTPAGGGKKGPEQQIIIIPEQAPLTSCLAALQACSRATATDMVFHGLIIAIMPLIHQALHKDTRRDPTLGIRHYIRQHCHEDLQRTAVAKHFAISPDHLTRLLRLSRSIGYVALIQQYRLERAAKQLRESEDSLSTIATECGFGSASYLIRLFRRHYGTTPEAWRLAWDQASGPEA